MRHDVGVRLDDEDRQLDGEDEGGRRHEPLHLLPLVAPRSAEAADQCDERRDDRREDGEETDGGQRVAHQGRLDAEGVVESLEFSVQARGDEEAGGSEGRPCAGEPQDASFARGPDPTVREQEEQDDRREGQGDEPEELRELLHEVGAGKRTRVNDQAGVRVEVDDHRQGERQGHAAERPAEQVPREAADDQRPDDPEHQHAQERAHSSRGTSRGVGREG
jgi:hypothetical protein